jgi:hypothetical protein
MFGDSSDTTPRDRSRINVEEAEDALYWTQELDVDEPTLRGAIQAVGDLPADVRDYIRLRKEADAV